MMWRAYGWHQYATGWRRPRDAAPVVVLSPSTHIAAGAATSTTQRLTGLTGTFTAGRISDDTNALPSINIGNDGNTELEWCVKFTSSAPSGAVYEFRVTLNGVPITTYSQTPQATVGTTGINLNIVATEGDDTSSVTLAQNNRLTVSSTEGDDTSAITITQNNRLTISPSEGDDTSSVTLTVNNRLTIAPTEGDDTSAITLAQNNRLTISPTEGDDTSSITLTQNNRLTITATEGNDTSDITLTVGSGINLNIAATEGDDTSSITIAVNNRLTISAVEGDDSSDIALSMPPDARYYGGGLREYVEKWWAYEEARRERERARRRRREAEAAKVARAIEAAAVERRRIEEAAKSDVDELFERIRRLRQQVEAQPAKIQDMFAASAAAESTDTTLDDLMSVLLVDAVTDDF